MLTIEDLFLAGLGFDIAGAYLVSRGLLQRIPQLATAGGTMHAMERPRATYAVEDRIRGSVGLAALMFGFALQAAGYTAILAGVHVRTGTSEAGVGIAAAVGLAVLIPFGERLARPRWRDRILIRVARFDYETGVGLRERPVAHVLRAFGEELSKPRLLDEDDVAYCERVFGVRAAVPTDG